MCNSFMFILKKIYFLLFILATSQAFAVGPCDIGNDLMCIGRSIMLTRSSGSAPHYLDVQNFNAYNILRNGFTFETYIKVKEQADADRTYIAGVWGPFSDANDSWVVYIDNNKDLIFEINNATTNLGAVDNTIAKYNLADTLWNKWFHLAVSWSPNDQFASIYINGNLKVTEQNVSYPASALKKPNSGLGLQIGSTNALYNTGGKFRTTLGEFDEIRIWSRKVTEAELQCNMDIALNGNEPGLEVYYRCNAEPKDFKICDATGNDREGLMRNGAKCDWGSSPNRGYNNPFRKISSPTFPDTIKCVKSKTYTWTFSDTATCGGEQYWILGYKWINGVRVWNNAQAKLTFNPTPGNRKNLDKDNIVTASVTVDADFVGKQSYHFYVQRTNLCGRTIFDTGEIDIYRITELDFSTDSLLFGSLLANCVEEPYRDITFKIYNNTKKTETNRPITINSLTTTQNNIFRVISPATPTTIPVGDSLNVTVRFTSQGVAATYTDNLVINSNDNCEGQKVIPIVGQVTDVIGILNNQGKAIDSVNFGTRCINQNEVPVVYFWENLSLNNIQVTSLDIPPQFVGMGITKPVTLEPNKSYQQRYFSFKPTKVGDYSDSVIFTAKAGGCTVRKVIYVKGKGIDPKFEITIDTLDFGSVFIGQTKELSVDVENTGKDLTRTRGFLYQGDRFFISGGGILNISPNSTQNTRVTFQPLEDSLYFDKLYIEETGCKNVKVVVIKGKGVTNAFEYNPKELRTLNVLACSNRRDTISITNVTSNPINLNNFQLLDPSTKFSLIEPNAGNLNGFSYNLKSGEELPFIFDYIPNDVSGDRADQARLTYVAAGLNWELKLIATSVVPKVYMTDEVNYGILEVGEKLQDIVIVENISNAEILLDSLRIEAPGGGFKILDPVGELNKLLKPRDTIHVHVEFEPTSATQFNGTLYSYVSKPCQIPEQFAVKTTLVGWGRVVPLEITQIALTMGQVKPCDCSRVQIPLRNRARFNDINIDSIWIDDTNRNLQIVDAKPEFYSFSSLMYNGSFPYKIPVKEVDTLTISYCPRGPWDRDSLLHNASIHVKASGPGWSTDDEVYLDGIQMLIFESAPKLVEFPPTRVDTLSVEQYALIKIPYVDVNQSNAPITIDSITFSPDNKVFFASSTFGQPFPLTITPPDSLWLGINFKPRAARDYKAKMLIHYSQPCEIIDSSIEVYGRGFAPVFGLRFEFDDGTQNKLLDTFMIPSCDTLTLPIYSNRTIPGDIVDIRCNIYYDKSKFAYISADASYLDTNCYGYLPNITETSTTFGSRFLLKNFCYVDSLKPIFYANFIPTNGYNSGFSQFKIDSISFDTEEVILFDIIAQNDSTIAEVRFVDHKILNDISFDSIRVLDCVRDTLYLKNTGQMPVLVDDLIQPINDITLIEILPLFGDTLFIGDTLYAIYEYCPSQIYSFDTLLISSIINPCKVVDTTSLKGSSYAPIYYLKTDIDPIFTIQDTIFVSYDDTINVPIYIDKDLFTNYNGVDYWITNLSFDLSINYNPRALKYLESTSLHSYIDNSQLGRLRFHFENIDSLKASEILNLQFKATVSDSIYSAFDMYIDNFAAKLLFLDLTGESNSAAINSEGSCNITLLNYSKPLSYLTPNFPNPWAEKTSFEFNLAEDSKVEFNIYSAEGRLIYSIYNNENVKKGNYKIELNGTHFQNGVYYYELKSDKFNKSGQFLKIK